MTGKGKAQYELILHGVSFSFSNDLIWKWMDVEINNKSNLLQNIHQHYDFVLKITLYVSKS